MLLFKSVKRKSLIRMTALKDCAWQPVIPLGHTQYSWSGTIIDIPIQESKQPEIKSAERLYQKKSSSIMFQHLRSNKDKIKIKQNMKCLTNNMFICKFCQHTLEKKSVCFTPNCYYWSSPTITKTETKHNTICHRNNKKKLNKKYNDNNLMNDDRSKWHRFKGVLAYDGYDFYGWQSQLNVETIQDLLEWRLSQFFKCKINVIGCSRTDAKVHANNQIFHVDLPIYANKQLNNLNSNELSLFIQKILNSLPKSICIKSIEQIDKTFHSRFSCFGKRYIYSIIQKERCLPFEQRYNYNINEMNRKEINIKNMIIASQILIGKHNFTALAVQNDKNTIQMPSYKGEIPSPIKYMKQIKILSRNNERNIEIHMISSGFLYKMARSIAGTLIEIGFDNLSIKEFECIFKSQKRTKQIITAPGHGLAIDKVFYDEKEWQQITNE